MADCKFVKDYEVESTKTLIRKEHSMRGRGALILLLGLLVFSGAFAQGTGSDWQYFNVFNLIRDSYGTQIPSNYTTSFGTVTSFTPAREKGWTTFETGSRRTETGVYGLPGVDNVNWYEERLIQLRHDRAVLRLDLLAASSDIYITGIKLTIWGTKDFDPNEDLAPLKPSDARIFYDAWPTDEDKYTGVQFYVDRDDGIPAHAASCDIFDVTDVEALPERILESKRTYYVDYSAPVGGGGVPADSFVYDPDDPSDPTLKWIKIESDIVVNGYTMNKWIGVFPFNNAIAIPAQSGWTGKNLPFKRIWIVIKTTGCHGCGLEEGEEYSHETTSFMVGGPIEGLSMADTFYIGVDHNTHIDCYINNFYQHKSIPPVGKVEVRPTHSIPSHPTAGRWKKAELLYGVEDFKPQIFNLYPANLVGSNGPHSDAIKVNNEDWEYGFLTRDEYEWASDPSRPTSDNYYIYTADATQLISFAAQDKQTCIESVYVEIRYLNGGNFPRRIDEIFFRNPMALPWDTANGGIGTGWITYIIGDGNDADALPTAGKETPDWGIHGEVDGIMDDSICGRNSFYIAVGNDGTGLNEYLDPFLDGAVVKVTVRVFNRTTNWDRAITANAWAETSWIFIVDLSGPNASLICPEALNHDNETREFRNYEAYPVPKWNFNRYDDIENQIVPYLWLADSLPVFTIEIFDDYWRIHDADNHGPRYTGAEGGSGFNQRDFTFHFWVQRKGAGTESGIFRGETPYSIRISESDMWKWYDSCVGDSVQGVYFDEYDNGTGGILYINFEYLHRSPYRADNNNFILYSGDKVYIVATEIYDDPDYGQGAQKFSELSYGSIDMYPSGSMCGIDGNDPNYGSKTSNRNHVPLWPVICEGYSSYSPDTLGIVRIDLKGPYAPDYSFYPPHGWITSDTTQVITVDLFDRIGYIDVDDEVYFKDSVLADTYNPLYFGVSGVNADSIIMNIKVRDCIGRWHPYYGGAEGRNFVINRTGLVPYAYPQSVPNLIIEKIRFHNEEGWSWWGTRVVYDPYPVSPITGEAFFRAGDEVCVTVYAADNAYANCMVGCDGFGPCPRSEGGCIIDGDYTSGLQKFSFRHYVPGNNWATDVLDLDGLHLEPRQIARWTFFVDPEPPKFEVSDFTQCPFEWDFLIRDVNRRVSEGWCDEFIADVAAVDVRIITIDDEDCTDDDLFPFNVDTIFINDLPIGGSAIVYHSANLGGFYTAYYGHGMDTCSTFPCCTETNRSDRYLYVSLEEHLGYPERDALLRLYWGDGTANSCHFFEPGDSVIVEIYAGDGVNVPWFPASERQVNWKGPYLRGTGDPYYIWHHEEDNYTGYNFLDPSDRRQYLLNTLWRTDAYYYSTLLGDIVYNYAGNGVDAHLAFYYNFESPNWQLIHTEHLKIQPELDVTEVKWFNDEGYETWAHCLPTCDFNFPPDLYGTYYDIDETTAPTLSAIGMRDPYLGKYAKDLTFITFDIQTCTDSIVWEHRAGSHPGTDSVVNHAPYGKVEIYDSTGFMIWMYEDWYDHDCIHCWLKYTPLRDGIPYGFDGCIDGGRLHMGPIDFLLSVDTVWDTTYIVIAGGELFPLYYIPTEYVGWPAPRKWFVSHTWSADSDSVYSHREPEYGYMNKDSMVITVGIHTRSPNSFGEDTIAEYHEYVWDYIIDIKPPTGRFAPLLSVSGGKEVNCVDRNILNSRIRVRLESLTDDGVGCSGGGWAEGWVTDWPLPAVISETDMLNYKWYPELNQNLFLEYNSGTHYLFTNENLWIFNCADEIIPAKDMGLVRPIWVYHGVADDFAVGTDLERDTLYIADSLWASAIIQDRLGNYTELASGPMGLDNGLPWVKGIAFCTAMRNPMTKIISTFRCWDPMKIKAPWHIASQDSIIGIYNFSPAGSPTAMCTIYVRVWFNDNMDMRVPMGFEGYSVKYQPEGWTHWFPVVPLDGFSHYYPLAEEYADYRDVASGPLYRSSAPSSPDDIDTEIPDAAGVEPGWNSDREWIGYMIISGDGIMDGVAQLSVQNFDDNARNIMLDHEYPFRIETRYDMPVIGWPQIEFGDEDTIIDPEHDSWEVPYFGGPGVLTSFLSADKCGGWQDIPDSADVYAVTFDPSITDSVVFDVYWHYVEWADSNVPGPAIESDYHWNIDDVPTSEYVWYSAPLGGWTARIPSDEFNLLLDSPWNEEVYATIVFKVYSRFYPGQYLADTLINIWIDNDIINGGIDIVVSNREDGDIPDGTDLLVFLPTTETIRIVLTGDELPKIDAIGFAWVDQVTGAVYPITDTEFPYDDECLTIDTDPSDGFWYDPDKNLLIYDWNCDGQLIPGLYTLHVWGTNYITNVYDNIEGDVWTEEYMHNFCLDRINLQVPREAYISRGTDLDNSLETTEMRYLTQPWAEDIYPWKNENKYSDYPGWIYIDESVIEGFEHLHRFQSLTFNNPDYTSGPDDPFIADYTEQGGYMGDSIYIIFELYPDDFIFTDSVKMVIEDEYGGNISGSNFRIVRWFYIPEDVQYFVRFHEECYIVVETLIVEKGDTVDTTITIDTLCVMEPETLEFLAYNWILDDQDNRYDGPVRITFTTYEENIETETVIPTDHPNFVFLDTYDPEYRVDLVRANGYPMFTCIYDMMPGEIIWVTNADTIDIFIYWMQTIFDQSETVEDYVSYDGFTYGRIWDFLRMTIDGAPHYGFHVDDPHDLLEAMLWSTDATVYDRDNPFWHQPEGGYDSYPFPMFFFANNTYKYRWTVATDPNGNGLANILVKGRDVAGNILDYDEARLSRSIGKLVLVDTEAPEVVSGLITLTAASMVAEPDGIRDNLLGEGFRDNAYFTYVYVSIKSLDGRITYVEGIPTNDDGSITSTAVSLTPGELVLVCAEDLAGNVGCGEVEVLPVIECCDWDLCVGWNMVSLSVIPDDLSRTSVFGDYTVYINRGNTWTPAPDILTPGNGYLVLVDDEATILSVCGDPLHSVVLDNLLSAWNLIGAIWGDVDITDVKVTPTGALDITHTYYFDCEMDGYVATTILEQCRGHIVWANVPCTLEIPDPDSKGITSTKKPVFTAIWNANILVKSGEIEKNLVIGVAEGATEGYDEGIDKVSILGLPGTPEVFIENHLNTDYRDENDELIWKVHTDINVSMIANLDDVPEDYNLYLVYSDGYRINLRETGNVMLNDNKAYFVAEKAVIPTAFELGGNYPNPFNVATVIAYEIPEDSDVRLEVFDISGHKVKTLVNETKTAGYKTVTWDGTDDLGNEVPSGVYLYRLTAKNYTNTKTMMLSK